MSSLLNGRQPALNPTRKGMVEDNAEQGGLGRGFGDLTSVQHSSRWCAMEGVAGPCRPWRSHSWPRHLLAADMRGWDPASLLLGLGKDAYAGLPPPTSIRPPPRSSLESSSLGAKQSAGRNGKRWARSPSARQDSTLPLSSISPLLSQAHAPATQVVGGWMHASSEGSV